MVNSDLGRQAAGDVHADGAVVIYFRIVARWPRVALVPEPTGDLEGFDIEVVPPCHFVASLMELTMVIATKRHCELITHLKPQRPGLCEAQVMRIRRLTSTNETWVRGNKSEVSLVTKALGLGNRQNALVNLAG